MSDAAPLAATAGDPKQPWIASAVWLVVWLLVAGWTAVILAGAWPYVQFMPQWLLLIAMPGLLFRAFDLLWICAGRRRVLGWRRWLARATALVAGVPAAAASWAALDAISMARFEQAMVPLVDRLHASAQADCPPESGWDLGAGFAAYLDAAWAPNAPVELHRDPQRFVLAVPGRSMDIDGSTMFYDSASRGWRKVHNDVLAQSGELKTLTNGLASCRFRLR
jgi:hypothetical protein